MKIEEAIEILNKEDFLWHNSENEVIEAVVIILKELDNKDKEIQILKQITKMYNTFKDITMAEDQDIVVLLKTDYERMTNNLVKTKEKGE